MGMNGEKRGSKKNQSMSLLFDVWLISHLTSGLLDEVLSKTGMSGDEFGLYSLLNRFGPVTPTQIARWTGMAATTVSAALKRLTVRGHTEQVPNPQDRRSYLIQLSQNGKKAHSAAGKAFLTTTPLLTAAFKPDEDRHRLELQRLDFTLRAVTGRDSRPYELADDGPTGDWQLAYTGTALSAQQEQDVRIYIEFIRAEWLPKRG
jgi:DNA-binding MarR family transcriptional regulator